MKTFAQLIASDPNIAPEFKAAMGFRPQCGRWGRVFLSQADADAYAAGYQAWPDPPDMLQSTTGPAWTGYFDHEHDQIERDEMRLEEAQEARERE